jgi:hypothetical protein
MVTGSEFDSPSLTGVAPATEPVTAAQAVALAEPPLDAEGQPTQPTLVELMSAAEAEGIVPTGLEGLISPKRSLWIVTVHAPMMTRGLPGVSVPREVDVYSVVVDACSGQVLTPGSPSSRRVKSARVSEDDGPRAVGGVSDGSGPHLGIG